MNWLTLNSLAFIATLSHFFIDIQIDLFGSAPDTLAPLQAINIAVTAILFGVWAHNLGLGGRGSKNGLVTAFIFSLLWAVVANGLVALIVAPPPSHGFPYQDIAHGLSLILGGAAAYVTWQEIKSDSRPVRMWGFPSLAIALIVAALAGQAILFF
jgi:hypothetical protein